MRSCSVDGCRGPFKAKGLCGKHYSRLLKHGSPNIRLKLHGDLMEWLHDHVGHSGDECLAWPFGRNSGGYGEVQFQGRPQHASRVMCILVHGEPPNPEMHAAHSCGHGAEGCVSPRHLRWATVVENAADKKLHGTSGHGEANAMARLDRVAAGAIRAAAQAPGANQRRIAAAFGVCQQTVSDIKRGKRWPIPAPQEARP